MLEIDPKNTTQNERELAVFFENGKLGSFSTNLFKLFSQADISNQMKLANAFPDYWNAYKLWFLKPEGWDTI